MFLLKKYCLKFENFATFTNDLVVNLPFLAINHQKYTLISYTFHIQNHTLSNHFTPFYIHNSNWNPVLALKTAKKHSFISNFNEKQYGRTKIEALFATYCTKSEAIRENDSLIWIHHKKMDWSIASWYDVRGDSRGIYTEKEICCDWRKVAAIGKERNRRIEESKARSRQSYLTN